MAEDGADYVHLSLHDAYAPPPFEDTKTPVARAVRDALPAGVPLMAAGNIWTAAQLEAAVAAGIDLPAVARVAIGNPDWARRVFEEGWEANMPPWTHQNLEAAAVGPAYRAYLDGFRGLTVGGRPARG